MNWTTPAQLAGQVERRWQRGEILAARLSGTALFPMQLRLKKPGAGEITDHFDLVRQWLHRLREASREQQKFGYEICWREVRHQVHGRNLVPETVIVPSEEDGLRLIGKLEEARRFSDLAALTLARFAELAAWLQRRPLILLAHAGDWPRILAVLDYFRSHPRPGLYLRQLDIPGVDTKFIEQRRGLLGELLDCILPEEAIDQRATGSRGFASRYGLAQEPPLIRFRLLDPALAMSGLTDLSVTPAEFARLRLPVQRVFITENKTNGLAFPPAAGALVIFGLGYGLDRLAEVYWLHGTTVHYWGDIDTHGFAILNRLRSNLPRARSFLMDRDTLLSHRPLWAREEAGCRFTGELPRLTSEEQQLFDDLKNNRLGDEIRLEQERIGYDWLAGRLATTLPL